MTLVSEIDETIVVPLIVNVMLTIVTAIDIRVLAMIAEIITEKDIANLLQNQSVDRAVSLNIRSEIEDLKISFSFNLLLVLVVIVAYCNSGFNLLISVLKSSFIVLLLQL